MAIALALGAALAYGSADFMGGLASRRTAPVAAAFGAQLVGLVVLMGVLPFLGPTVVGVGDLGFGAVAGVFGGLGLVAVFQALAHGPMSVVAPITALAASVVPILAGIVSGERPGLAVGAGIAVSFVAVVLMTREPTLARQARRVPAGVVALSLLGGAIFGLFFVALHHTNSSAGLWPLLAARVTSVSLLGALTCSRQGAEPIWPLAGTRRTVIVSGALDMGANVLYLLAIRQGMLAIVAAVAGLYPASTVVLARLQLRERLRPLQVAGLATAAMAAALIAL